MEPRHYLEHSVEIIMSLQWLNYISFFLIENHVNQPRQAEFFYKEGYRVRSEILRKDIISPQNLRTKLKNIRNHPSDHDNFEAFS